LPSIAHSKVEPASFAENAKLARVAFIDPLGPESIVVSGAVVSTATVRGAERAVYEREPSGTSVSLVPHDPPPSAEVVPREVSPSKISTVVPAVCDPATVTSSEFVRAPSVGVVRTGTDGAIVSTEHVRLAGVGSVFCAAQSQIPPPAPLRVCCFALRRPGETLILTHV
jgi:hypothetical protein